MAAMEDDAETRRGEEALERLRSADPPLYLSPSPELSRDARAAACYLYSSLVHYCPKRPLDSLLAGDGFDAEQIWYQIDLLSRPLLSAVRRDLNRIARDPSAHVFGVAGDAVRDGEAAEAKRQKVIEDGEDDEQDGDESEGDEEEEGEDESEEGEEEDADADEGDEDVDEDEEAGEVKRNNVEDKFLKIKDLEEYLDKEEEKEYGLQKEKRSRRKEMKMDEQEDEDEEDDDDDGGDEEDDLDLGDFDSDGEEDTELAENARYEDFFGGSKKKQQKQNGIIGKRKRSSDDAVDFLDGPVSKELDSEEENDNEEQQVLSTHEKALLKLHSKIEQMEKANMEPKSWTMQGEVTAAERPKNSALEVDLDFDHKVRPAPVITEEVTASLEDIIRKRIIEGHFDDVQRAPTLPSKAPKEQKELDESKSKKGLAEIYEEEYAQKSGLAPGPVSASDTLKNEANMLFKKLCSKLDALSHFHFAPKPVIEDMSIQVNVPALAMEEIAPLAVSDAAMLAPEEIFEGKGNIKEETELTKADRKRRRASKKRRFKARMTKRETKKAAQNGNLTSTDAKSDS